MQPQIHPEVPNPSIQHLFRQMDEFQAHLELYKVACAFSSYKCFMQLQWNSHIYLEPIQLWPTKLASLPLSQIHALAQNKLYDVVSRIHPQRYLHD